MQGTSLETLVNEFGYTKLTISRHLKKNIGEEKYKNITNSIKDFEFSKIENKEKYHKDNKNSTTSTAFEKLAQEDIDESFEKGDFLKDSSFIEIAPLNVDIENSSRKDLSSVPLDKIDLPKIVYMIVDKKIELRTKLLKEYATWQYLPEDDLNSKTIEIYSDLKNAKRDCKKEQKVIKIPNTNVFKISSKFLISQGITRIINDQQLILL